MRHRPIPPSPHQPPPIPLPPLPPPPPLIIHLPNPPLPPKLLIPALHNRERLHNVAHIIALDTIQVKIRRVKLAAQQETPLLIPAEWWPIVTAIFGERFQVPGSVGEFECSRPYPST